MGEELKLFMVKPNLFENEMCKRKIVELKETQTNVLKKKVKLIFIIENTTQSNCKKQNKK
jgi:hypothetical protein